MNAKLVPVILAVAIAGIVSTGVVFAAPAGIVRSDETVVFDANGTPFIDPDGSCQIINTNTNSS